MSEKKNDNPKKNEEEKEAPPPPTENQEIASAGNELSKLRADVDHLSDDLQNTVIDLKKSIVDIRSAVSEIENPFNLLRTISSEKDLKKINGERLPDGVKSLILGKPQENVVDSEETKELTPKNDKVQPSQDSEPQPQPQIENGEKTLKTEAQLEIQPKQPVISSEYLDWVWNLLDSGLKANDIHQLACSCESMGYLPTQANEFIFSLAIAAEKLREKGLTKADLLLNLYKAAAISKVNMSWEDMVALIAITEDQLKRSKPSKGAE